jgi:pyruvyl transferase EpsI
MKKLFPGNTVLLTPDIVLSSRNCDFSKNRSGAMICIRSDIESILDNNKKMLIAKILLKKYSNITYTDTVERGSLYRIKPNRLIVMKKLNQFRHKKIVVTDRLHGMVFSAITGTPCIALTNFNHKVLGTYKWIRKLGYIKFINSTDELESAIELLDTSKRYTYDPSVFNIYWQHISLALGAEKQ